MVAARVEEVPYLSRHILDAGSGTGHHLAQIVARLPGIVIGLGLDISKDAARQAARRWPASAFAVADLWADWPVHDAAVDLVVSIFAPKNFPETARVLRPGGSLALAYPGPKHLIELRDRFGLLRQDEESPGRYVDMATRFIGSSTVARLRSRAVLDPAMAYAVILMGPNAGHVDLSILDDGVGPYPLAVTFDINVLFARKTERKS
jgi:23S rRNA (guanine745-N1)-methyltransferase